MQQERKYDEDFDSRTNVNVVLTPKAFKPLINIKTNNIFSYSFALVEAGNSANSEGNIRWVEDAPKALQEKINKVRQSHQNMVSLKANARLSAKQKDVVTLAKLESDMSDLQNEIDEVIYPSKDRKYIESAEAKRQRLTNANQLTIDEATINAIKG